jgi:hypothetical protein
VLEPHASSPPPQARVAATTSVPVGSKAQAYQSFWEALVEAGIKESDLWQGFTPRGYEHLTIPLPGVSRAICYLIVNQKQIHMELVFTTGEGSPNIEIFERLYERRAEVEAAFGQPLLWKRFAKTSKVQYVAAKGSYQERPDWSQLIQPTVQHFEPFWKAIQGCLEI